MGTDASPPSSQPTPPALPALFVAALNAPQFARRNWQAALATHYIGLFLWVAFFDQIPQETLPGSRLAWPVVGAAIGGILSYFCLYRCPATWGMRTGQPLDVLATSTFGVRGATWIPGLLLALVQVAWVAVSVWYATSLSLRGLVLIRILDPQYLLPITVAGAKLPGLLFVTTSLLWMLAATMAGRYLVRVIVALMLVYPVVEALLIAAAALFAFRGLPSYRPEALGPLVPASVPVRVIIQIMFGFFATAGLTSADWGRTLESEKDVRMGGLVAVAFASWVVATLAVLTVAGSGFAASEVGGIRPPGSFRYVAAVEALFPGRVAGGILMTFGLAGLAPAVFASSVFGMRLHAIRPKLSRTKSAIVVTVVAWLLVVTGLGARIYSVIGVVGGLLTPAAGAIAADYVLSRGNWPGPRQGFNRPGVLAWFVGAIIGVLPTFLPLPRLQPASVVAFVAAFLVYWLATTRGLAAPFEPMPELEVATHE